ncbi:MAG: FtsQ-type POTRA domain-containing protein [Armatimonadetes bacterium]|nr:FtsQ-type POTRA domain-containing protein [Armatimonadota bacterium]
MTDAAAPPRPGEVPPNEDARAGARSAPSRRERCPWPTLRLAILACFVAALFSLPSSSFFRVEQIQVAGTKTLPAEAIAAAAGISLGTRLSAIDVAAAAERLEALPAVRAASVRAAWPSTLQIEVVERVPVIALRFTEAPAAFLVLDAEAVPFRHAEEPGALLAVSVDDALLPWLRLGQPIPLRLVRETAEALKALDPTHRARVRAIRITGQGDLDVTLSSGPSALVRSPSALREKLPLAWQIAQGLGSRIETIGTIDLRFGDNVVVRPAPGAPSPANPAKSSH